MSKPIKTVLAFLLMVAAFIYLFFGPTAVRQGINLRKARKHIPIIEQSLKQYHNVKDLRVGAYTGEGGCIVIYGLVTSEKERDELMKIAASTNPPVKVVDNLLVQDELDRRKKEQGNK